jgi:hypothetical protein
MPHRPAQCDILSLKMLVDLFATPAEVPILRNLNIDVGQFGLG